MSDLDDLERVLDEYIASVKYDRFYRRFDPRCLKLLVCSYCDGENGFRQHQNTSYCDDERNYIIACDACADEINERWQEQWDEYWAGCL